MPTLNPYEQYRKNQILTASPAEITLMLYEGAIKFCNKAIEAVNKQEVEKAYENIVKGENIIVEFKATLNHNYEVAKDFDILYDYIYDRLVAANMSKDPEILEEVLTQLRDMRDNWKTIMQSSVRR